MAVSPDVRDLIEMADFYVNKCTRQEEKALHYIKTYAVPWRWVDCEAAYGLLCERPDYWELMTAWRRGTLEVLP